MFVTKFKNQLVNQCSISNKIKSNLTRRTMVSNKEHLSQIFSAGVASVQPQSLLARTIHVEGNRLHVKGREYTMSKNCYVVGFGKAVLGMATQLESILGEALTCGICTIPAGTLKQFAGLPQLLPPQNSRITFLEGAANNTPDVNAYNGAMRIRKLVTTVAEGDILIVLISGGGSALLPVPVHPVTLEEKTALIRALGKAGASIIELNTVRKKLSELKGGGLALLASRAKIISLILSDVIGDPLDFIASGPTVLNIDDPDAALKIVIKYNLLDFTSDSVRQVLSIKSDAAICGAKSTPKDFDWVYNVIIGNNVIACEAAVKEATSLGYQSLILTALIAEDVDRLCQWYVELLSYISAGNQQLVRLLFDESRSTMFYDLVDAQMLIKFDQNKPICLISSGEPTCVVKGTGRGGRSIELALRCSIELDKLEFDKNITILCAGTDGMDGPTDAAGAYGSSVLFKEGDPHNMDPTQYLNNNDSYGFYNRFRKGEYLLKTGYTGTNVMDLHVITITPKDKN